MSAIQALGAARAFGIHLQLDGDDLLLEASEPPPDAVLDALSRHKADVVRILRSAKDGSSPDYWISCSRSVQPLPSLPAG